MCIAAIPAMVGLSIATAGTGLIGQMQQAKGQKQANAIQEKNAITAFEDQTAALGLSQQQDIQNTLEEVNQSSIEARKARASTRVAAGEMGISGALADTLQRDIYRQEANYSSNLGTNLNRTIDQKQEQKKASSAQAAGIINSLKPVQRPDYVGAALKIGESYFAGEAMKESKKNV